ncbi:hypothetical protein JB92DRAFT_2739920, partial [Gautieria morchelliformis]
DVKFIVNVQHDCRSAHCGLTGSQVHHQEWKATNHTSPALHHADDHHFVLNLTALHNAALVRQTLPHAHGPTAPSA